jgi:hypothetical protein
MVSGIRRFEFAMTLRHFRPRFSCREPPGGSAHRIVDFERWPESQGRTPAEMSLKARLQALLGELTRVASRTTRNRT